MRLEALKYLEILHSLTIFQVSGLVKLIVYDAVMLRLLLLAT